MRNSFSFAVTLHRAFDSAPPKAKALFYAGDRQIKPIEKPNGLYVFLQDIKTPLTVECHGFMRETVAFSQGGLTPATLYPDRLFAVPAGWKLISGDVEPDSLMYVIDGRYELKLTEHNADKGFACIRSRNGFTGGSLVFEADEKKEIALILEKQSPDVFYLSRLNHDYAGGTVRRVYPARANAGGMYHLVLPEDFDLGSINYLYI